MGTDITGAIAHQLDFPPPASLLLEMASGIERVSPYIEAEWKWLPEYDNERDFRAINNSGGPTVWIGRRAALIVTGVGWDQAAEDSELREQITAAILAIARFFKSPCAVLLPDDIEPWCNIVDSIQHDGCTLDQFVASLAQIRAADTELISAMRGPPDNLVDGYVILDSR